jgi:hypothetical protein
MQIPDILWEVQHQFAVLWLELPDQWLLPEWCINFLVV